MIPIPASILAIENESDRDFMENIFFSYQRLIYHEIGSILNDPWSKDDIFQTVIVQLINKIDTLRPMPAKVLTSYIATSVGRQLQGEFFSFFHLHHFYCLMLWVAFFKANSSYCFSLILALF